MKPTNIKFYENSCIIKEMDLNGETYVHYHTVYKPLDEKHVLAVNVPEKVSEAVSAKWELVATFYDLSEYSGRYSFYKVTLESGEVVNIFSDHDD